MNRKGVNAASKPRRAPLRSLRVHGSLYAHGEKKDDDDAVLATLIE